MYTGLLAIFAKSIAIAIAILGGKSNAILIAILFTKPVLQYFLQYSTILSPKINFAFCHCAQLFS